MKLIISDTNIFIDLLNIELIDEFLNLEYEIHTTDFVLLEISAEQNKELQKRIDENKIILDKADADELDEINELRLKKKSLSLVDISVYFFAKKQNAIVLTGDKSFRNYAIEQKLEVKGILWVLDEILDKNLLTKSKMIERLEILMTTNKRLPKEECDKRLIKWGKVIE